MTTKRFQQLAKKLDEALEESTDIFLSERPFVSDKSLQPEIKEFRTDQEIERKVDNEILIEEVTNAITR